MRLTPRAIVVALSLGLVAAGCRGSGEALPPDSAATTLPVTPASAGRLLRVQLPPVEAAPGIGVLYVAVRAPDGFDAKGDAPSLLTLDATSRKVVDLGEHEVDWNTGVPDAGWPVPVRLAPGTTTITAAGTVYFCRAGEEEVCRFQRIELTLPVTVSRSSATSDLELSYRLPPLSSP